MDTEETTPHPPPHLPPTSQSCDVVCCDDVCVDKAAREVTVAGAPVSLTVTEYSLLLVFIGHPRRALSRRRLIELVWGEDWFGDDHMVAVHVSNLRRKINDRTRTTPLIVTVHSYGYRLDADPIQTPGSTHRPPPL